MKPLKKGKILGGELSVEKPLYEITNSETSVKCQFCGCTVFFAGLKIMSDAPTFRGVGRPKKCVSEDQLKKRWLLWVIKQLR